MAETKRASTLSDISLLIDRFRPSHLREMAWLSLSNVSSIVLGFGLIKVISKIGTAEYGKYALVISVVPLVNSIIYNPIDKFCQRYYYTHLYKKESTFFFINIVHILKKIGMSLLILCVSALVILRYAFNFELQSISFLLISCFYILVFTNVIPFQSLLNTMRLRRQVALFAVGEKLAQLIILSGISFLVGLDTLVVFAVFAVVGVVFLTWKIQMVKDRMVNSQESKRGWNENNPREISRQLMSFGLPILVFGVLAWLQIYSERWVIRFALDLDSVGIYVFMVMIVNTSLMIVLGSVSQFVGPITWEKFSDLSDLAKVAIGLKFIRVQVWFVGFVTASAAVGLFFVGEWAIKVLGGNDFSAHSKLLPLIFIGIGLFYIGQTLNSVGFGYNRMSKYTTAKVSGAILTLVSYWLGASIWGLSGVAWASVVANSIYVALTVFANRGILREQLASKELVEQGIG